MPVTPTTERDLQQYEQQRYPNPFFDLANSYIPKNIKTLFKFCRSYFYTNGFLRNVVTKLTEYPITELLFEKTTTEEVRKKYSKAFKKHLKLKALLIEIGLDYFNYGNAFVATNLKAKRYLQCPACGERSQIENTKFKLYKFQFQATCNHCGARDQIMEVDDEPLTSINSFNLVRFAPENLDIEYNPLTGTSSYFYTIPVKIRQQIMAGNMTVLKEIPMVFLDSLRLKKKIELDTDNLYHFKSPTLAEDDMGWGKPIILPALKEIFYLQTLRRGNEAIAQEHIIPKKAVFPANTTQLDPFTQLNLGKWKTEIQDQVKKWKQDPNHIGVFPIPIGYQELGGNARALLLTPEMKFIEESIINSLGVPLEFIKGGTTWTGSSVSLRIVENHFITYREMLAEFINYFLIDKMVTVLKYPPVEMRFQKFKMTDDSESKQLALQLSSTGKISDSRLLEEFGISYEEEAEAKKMAFADELETQAKAAEMQAEAQGRAMVIQARYQVRAEKAAEDEGFRIQAENFQDELAVELGGIPEEPIKYIERVSLEIMSMDNAAGQTYLAQINKDAPYTHALIVERLRYMMMSGAPMAQTPEEQAGMPIGSMEQAMNEEKPPAAQAAA